MVLLERGSIIVVGVTLAFIRRFALHKAGQQTDLLHLCDSF
jgi:hypothetical protein